MCLIGKQHGGLAYTLTLLPGETMTLYQSDRYRRTTAETERYSTQTTFSQFVSALYQQQTSSDSSAAGPGAEQPDPERQRIGRRRHQPRLRQHRRRWRRQQLVEFDHR